MALLLADSNEIFIFAGLYLRWRLLRFSSSSLGLLLVLAFCVVSSTSSHWLCFSNRWRFCWSDYLIELALLLTLSLQDEVLNDCTGGCLASTWRSNSAELAPRAVRHCACAVGGRNQNQRNCPNGGNKSQWRHLASSPLHSLE